MVSETFEAPVDTPSQLPETPSDSPELAPSVTPDAEPADAPDENTPVAEDETTEPEQPQEPNLETALEKRKSIERGDKGVSLDADEYRLLREHDRAEENRRRDFEARQAEERQQIETLSNKHAETTQQVVEEVYKLSDWLQRFGGGADEITAENVRTRIAGLIDGLKSTSQDIILKPHLQSQRDLLTRAYGDNPSTETLRTISGLQTQEQILSHAYEMGRAYGQTEGAPKGKVLVDEKDYKRWTTADQAEEKSQKPEDVPPGGRVNRNGSKPYSAMTPEERAALSPEERDRLTSGLVR